MNNTKLDRHHINQLKETILFFFTTHCAGYDKFRLALVLDETLFFVGSALSGLESEEKVVNCDGLYYKR